MKKLFKNRYLVPSTRLQFWDYSSDGLYFITICTKHRINFFGEIQNGEMQLSNIGKIVNFYWEEIPQHFDNVSLGEYICMPNHFHGIIIINTNSSLEMRNCIDSKEIQGKQIYFESCTKFPIKINRFQNQGKNTVSSIVGSFKSKITKEARKINNEFGWLPRFYDHIIRDERSYINISNYIKNNPIQWQIDSLRKDQ